MTWRKPQFDGEFPSLGWGVIDFIESGLRVPLGKDARKPLRLTDEQVEFLVRLYRIDPVTGARTVRRAQLRRAKGWGKSPLVAGLAVAELCGPVRFGGWDADGEPIGIPESTPWVQIAATAEDQTDNTWKPLMAMLVDSPLVEQFDLDVGLTRIVRKGTPDEIEFVTSKAGTREGQAVTFAVLDETHLWDQSNGGKKLADTIRRNVAKTNGLSVETTNAHTPGMGSVAEDTQKAIEDERTAAGILVDTLEGPDVPDPTDTPKLIAALRVAYGDSKWVDLSRIAAEYIDPNTDPSDAARFYLNRLVAAGGQLVNVALWDQRATDGQLRDGDVVALGFDGARFRDSTALAAVRIEDGFTSLLNLWERPEGVEDWEIDGTEVDAAMRDAFARFRVQKAFFDPPYWQDPIAAWSGLWPNAVEKFHTNRDSLMVWAVARWLEAIRSGELTHDGDKSLRTHVANAQRKLTRVKDDKGRPMPVMTKDGQDSARKIDGAMAACLAWSARAKALESGITAEDRTSAYSAERGLIIL